MSSAERANGGTLEIIDYFPFMLSWSKHENHFFRSYLDGWRELFYVTDTLTLYHEDHHLGDVGGVVGDSLQVL